MTGHRVRAKKKMDMENQSKLGKYLVEKTIKEISTRSTPQLFLDNMLILMTILLLYSISGALFFWEELSHLFSNPSSHTTRSLFKFSTTLTFPFLILAFHFLSFHTLINRANIMWIIKFELTFSLNANFHQSIFSRCRVNSWFFKLRAGMVYLVKRTNKGLCKIRLKGFDYGNTSCNDGVIIRTAGKVFWL